MIPGSIGRKAGTGVKEGKEVNEVHITKQFSAAGDGGTVLLRTSVRQHGTCLRAVSCDRKRS